MNFTPPPEVDSMATGMAMLREGEQTSWSYCICSGKRTYLTYLYIHSDAVIGVSLQKLVQL
jgi:hypothetical protein